MKSAVIILGIICVLLSYAIYKKSDSANKQIEAMATNQVSLTNQIKEVTTKLMMSEGTGHTAKSNLQFLVDKRTSDLNIVSNRLVQTHLLYQDAQKSAHATDEQLQARVARIAVLEAEIESLRRAAAAVANDPSAREAESLRKQLAAVSRERDALKTQFGTLQVQHADLESRLLDVEFLNRQLKDAEEAAEIRRRMASSRAGASPDKRMKLELQPDGTVKYVTPPPSPPAPSAPNQ
jgi:chromosome segregation ATPase